MKYLIAIVALVVSAHAAAFWGWNDTGNYGYGNTYNNGGFDGIGNGEADFAFDFDMNARINFDGRGYGNGYGAGNGYGYGYNRYAPYYGAPYGYPPMMRPPAPTE